MPTRRRGTPEQILADQLAGGLLDALATRRGRQLLLVAVVCIGVVLLGLWIAGRWRTRHPVGPTVRLATWNLREFSVNRKGVDLPTIAGIIRDNRFDVVAVQEVKRDGGEVTRLVDTLGVPWRAARYSDVTGNSERFAFIYDADHVSEVGTPHFIATTEAVIFDRTPYQDTFLAGRFRFTLIEVHLSYGDTARREREGAALARYADRLQRSGGQYGDVIVCGDFNEQPAHDVFRFFTSAGWESLNHDPTNLTGTAVYDTFLIDPRQTTEWTGTAASVHYNNRIYNGNNRLAEERVSDHRPAYADFVTGVFNASGSPGGSRDSGAKGVGGATDDHGF